MHGDALGTFRGPWHLPSMAQGGRRLEIKVQLQLRGARDLTRRRGGGVVGVYGLGLRA